VRLPRVDSPWVFCRPIPQHGQSCHAVTIPRAWEKARNVLVVCSGQAVMRLAGRMARTSEVALR